VIVIRIGPDRRGRWAHFERAESLSDSQRDIVRQLVLGVHPRRASRGLLLAVESGRLPPMVVAHMKSSDADRLVRGGIEKLFEPVTLSETDRRFRELMSSEQWYSELAGNLITQLIVRLGHYCGFVSMSWFACMFAATPVAVSAAGLVTLASALFAVRDARLRSCGCVVPGAYVVRHDGGLQLWSARRSVVSVWESRPGWRIQVVGSPGSLSLVVTDCELAGFLAAWQSSIDVERALKGSVEAH
jgi:hypothetical protein